MKIRIAKESDFLQISVLVKEFVTESLKDFSIIFSPEHVKVLTQQCCNSSFVAEKDGEIVGVIGGYVGVSLADGSSVYQEVIWYVKKEFRGVGMKLLKKLEEYCAIIGINRIVIAHMNDKCGNKVRRFYNRNGFELIEMHYSKRII